MKVKYDFITGKVTFSNQPTCSVDGKIQVLAAATIYDRPTNCKTDEEAILHAYMQYGTDCPKYLRGTFAFCIYDERTQSMLVARDRLGERRLYYSKLPTSIVFSTDLRVILKEDIAEPQINVQHLLEPVRFTGPIDMENTWVEQIKRIQMGQLMIVNPTGIRTDYYWKLLHTETFAGTREEALKQTLDLMRESVDNAMHSSKKVAVTLSGGVDSSCVAALAKQMGHEVYSITTGYKGSYACDERDVARQFAKEQGFHHTELEFTEQDYLDAFEEMTQVIDEPITDSTAIAQWAMYKRVKAMGFDVLLGGMGGDELFFGYPVWNHLGESLHKRRELESIFPWNSKAKKMHYLRYVLQNWRHMLYGGYPNKLEDKAYGWWIHDDYYRFVEKATLNYNGQIIPLKDFLVYKDFAPCSLGQEVNLIYDDCRDKIMTGAYLYVDDCLGAALDLENRSPLIDYKVVEFAMNTPLSMRFSHNKPKQFMKDMLAGIVPDYILYANKRGFTSPKTYIDIVSQKHNYHFIHTDAGFYNSALCDQMLTNLL